MGVKSKQHSAEFKARVAMASLSGRRPWRSYRRSLGFIRTMISNWKQELVKRAGELFARGKAPAAEDAQKVIDDLHRKIGQLQVERDFLAGQPCHLPIAERRAMIAPEAGLSVIRQCALLGIARSSFYYRPRSESAEELEVLQRHCQVASSGRAMAKPTGLESGCRRSFGNIVPRAEGRTASRAILVGIEVMTTELEMVVDPTVGREEALRMTR